MSERPGYIPPEARQETKSEAETEKKLEKPNLRPETKTNIQYGPPQAGQEAEAVGTPRNRIGPDGNLITPEHTTRYHDPGTTKELGTGDGPNPTRNQAPDDATSDHQVSQSDDTDDQGQVSDDE